MFVATFGVPRGPQVPGFFRFFLYQKSSKVIESHTEAAADPSGPRKQHCQRSTEWHGVARSGTESLRSVSCCQLRSERRRGCLESGRWKCRLTLRVATGRSVSGWDRWEWLVYYQILSDTIRYYQILVISSYPLTMCVCLSRFEDF